MSHTDPETTTDAELLERFESNTLDPARFSHREHVRVAWLLLRRDGLVAALGGYRTRLQQLTSRVGKPEVYHETITFASLLLVWDRLGDASETFSDFAARCPELFVKPSLLDRLYQPATLASRRARERFVLPDSWNLSASRG